jgi:hypothetical protein
LTGKISDLNNKKSSSESEKDKLIFDLIYQRQKNELERLNYLDQKASNTILFVGIILGLVSTLVSIFIGNIGIQENIFLGCINIKFLLILGILFLTASIFCGTKAYYVKTLDVVPDTSHLIEKYAKNSTVDYETVIQIIGTEISNSIKDNKKIIDEKADFIKYSLRLFECGMILTVIFICGVLVN